MTSSVALVSGRNHKCMLNDALKYLSFGWSVMPLRPCSKEPLLSSWTKYQTERATAAEVTEWFTRTPDANLAIITGRVSDLGVVDVDGEEGFTTLARLGLQSPATSLTGKGRQLLFRHPGAKLSNAVRTLPGIDIRGDGGYIAAPPSIHPNGKRYTWLNGALSVVNLAPFPVSVFAPVSDVSASPKVGKPAGWMADALRGLENGNRADTFAAVIGRMHRDRWTPDDIRTVLLPHALRVEFPELELDRTIRSVTRYPVVISGTGNGRPVGNQPGNPGEPAPKLVLRSFANDFDEYRKRKSTNRVLEFGTGYRRFDAITTGLQRGELTIVGARTETGKTNWLLGSAHGLCSGSKRVLYLSTEMSFERIWDRYLTIGGNPETHSFLVCDDFAPHIGRIREAIAEAKADVFIFDHINIVGDDSETISRFLKGLKELAREFNIPGIVAAQLNRQAEWKDQEGKPVEPELHHLKGSGAIEEVAAQVLLLQVVGDEPDNKFVQGWIKKNRYGEKGPIDFVLRKKPYRMEEL
jgi:hypothetical protein